METMIVLGVSVAILIVAYFVFRGDRKKYFKATLKVIALIYLAIAFVRYMLSDSFIWVINKGVYGGKYYEYVDVLQSVVRWGHYVSYVVYIMAAFFDSRLFKNIAVYFCLPFAVISCFCFNRFMGYFMGDILQEVGRGIQTSYTFRAVYFGIELILAIVIPLMIAIIDKHKFNIKDKVEWRNFLVALPFIILSSMPVYIPQSILGYTKFTANAMTIGNFIWIGVTFVEIAILYWVFRFKDYKTRYMLCMYLALALFMHYNSLYLMGFSVARLPIQLCNLGAYFFVLTLILKSRSFFNFTFLANIVGTMIAMIMPDTSGGFAGFWNIHFLIEHTQVLVVPMLCMLLRIFPRLEKSALKHLVIGFSIYFVFCWVSGTMLNGFADIGGYGRVNFFYIFDLEKAFGYFPFLSFTKEVGLVILGRFKIWPLFQFIIYLGFLGLCVGFYFVMIKFYETLDDHFELRKARIDMYERLTGKKSKCKREYED